LLVNEEHVHYIDDRKAICVQTLSLDDIIAIDIIGSHKNKSQFQFEIENSDKTDTVSTKDSLKFSDLFNFMVDRGIEIRFLEM